MRSLSLEIEVFPIGVGKELNEPKWRNRLNISIPPIFLSPELQQNNLPSMFHIHSPDGFQSIRIYRYPIIDNISLKSPILINNNFIESMTYKILC